MHRLPGLTLSPTVDYPGRPDTHGPPRTSTALLQADDVVNMPGNTYILRISQAALNVLHHTIPMILGFTTGLTHRLCCTSDSDTAAVPWAAR